MNDDFGFRNYRASIAWVRSNLPLIIFGCLAVMSIATALYGWGHAMGKRDLLIASGIAGSEGRTGRG